jgi:hypothetical protein
MSPQRRTIKISPRADDTPDFVRPPKGEPGSGPAAARKEQTTDLHPLASLPRRLSLGCLFAKFFFFPARQLIRIESRIPFIVARAGSYGWGSQLFQLFLFFFLMRAPIHKAGIDFHAVCGLGWVSVHLHLWGQLT